MELKCASSPWETKAQVISERSVKPSGPAFSTLSQMWPRISRMNLGMSRNTTVEVLIEGTQHKKFERIPSLGRHFVLPHAFLFSLSENANITQAAIYWDNVTLFSDLGKTTLDSWST